LEFVSSGSPGKRPDRQNASMPAIPRAEPVMGLPGQARVKLRHRRNVLDFLNAF
jgi:hypothetical protein